MVQTHTTPTAGMHANPNPIPNPIPEIDPYLFEIRCKGTGLSLGYILRASLARDPHCFRAHVPGSGYVNDGGPGHDRAEFLRQYRRAAVSEFANMITAPGYAEPGYTDPAVCVLFANWNNAARGLDTILERAGFAVEWSDEWITCDACGKALRSSPDSYVWRPSYVDEHGDGSGLLCPACHGEYHGDSDTDTDSDSDSDSDNS